MKKKETRENLGRPAELGLFHSKRDAGNSFSPPPPSPSPPRLLHDISIFVNANGLRNFAVHPGGHHVCVFVFFFPSPYFPPSFFSPLFLRRGFVLLREINSAGFTRGV